MVDHEAHALKMVVQLLLPPYMYSRSSMAELSAHNGNAVGSIPSESIILCVIYIRVRERSSMKESYGFYSGSE